MGEDERREMSGGRGVEGKLRRERSEDGVDGTEQNCRQNLEVAEITPILGIGGVTIFVRVKSQKMKAVGASFDESNPPLSAL